MDPLGVLKQKKEDRKDLSRHIYFALSDVSDIPALLEIMFLESKMHFVIQEGIPVSELCTFFSTEVFSFCQRFNLSQRDEQGLVKKKGLSSTFKQVSTNTGPRSAA